ncbi:MAG: hypothetical protein M3198_11145 [Actinomycetota bacterium]|nr:hypothetical protein [Actinomycetota bacterium]
MVLHGPLDFDWGHPRAPQDLALALLADALDGGDDPLVDEFFRRFWGETVRWLPWEGWQLHQKDIVDWVHGRISRIPVYPLPLGALGGGVSFSHN